jgi:hypothetical protein
VISSSAAKIIECETCKTTESAVLALASTASPDGWFIERMKLKAGGSRVLTLCPKCFVAANEILSKRREANNP